MSRVVHMLDFINWLHVLKSLALSLSVKIMRRLFEYQV
jgi:hypothetical protein